MKKLLLVFAALALVLTLSACKKDLVCDEGFSNVDEVCVADDTTAPVITGPTSHSLAIHTAFDPLVDVTVTATDDVDETVAVTVKSNNLDVDLAGSYTVVYEAKDAAGNAATHTLTVGVDVNDANHLAGVDLAKITAEEKSVIFAQAERYLMDNLYGGVPLWTNADLSMYSERVQLFTTTYNTVMGYGTGFSQFTADDSTVKMDVNNTLGTAGEYTWRDSFSVDPVTLNPWIAEDAVSSAFVGLFEGGLYNFYFDASKTGYEINGENAAGEPTPVGGEEVNGKFYSKVWQIELKDDLEWYFHPSIDTSGFAAGYEELDASDYLWTWETALSLGWFRAYSGGGDFISAGVKNAEAFYAGTVTFDQVGLSMADGETNTLEVEFTSDKTAFDIKYMFAQTQTAINQELFDSLADPVDYGTSPTTVAASGVYYMDVWTPNQLITFKANPNFVEKDMYHYTGQQFTFIADENAVFSEFLAGRLDGALVPAAQAEAYSNDDRVYAAPDAATWRLNFNGFGTEDARDEYIAQYPELGLDETFVPEPILSYTEMRQAFYYGVNRGEAALNVVKTFLPATTYMSGMYFLDAASGLSVRGTDVGMAVETDYAGTSYGYYPDAATDLFKEAVAKAIADGFYSEADANGTTLATATAADPYVIDLLFTYHSPTHLDRASFVSYIVPQYELIFVDDVNNVVVEFEVRPVAYPDHYDSYLQVAATDVGIGAISGSLLDAPSFLDVFNDDNAGGFTMNWGIDTHTANIPITFTLDGEIVTEMWSYNAIAKALNGKTYIKDGVIQEYWDSEAAVVAAYLDMNGTSLDSSSDGSALMEVLVGMTEAEYATELDVETVNALIVVGNDGSNFLYVISGDSGQFELISATSLITDLATSITVHAGYPATDLYADTAVVMTDATVLTNAYLQTDLAPEVFADLADVFTYAEVPAGMLQYAEAVDVGWDGIYGAWSDVYVVYHIGDYYIGFAWL